MHRAGVRVDVEQLDIAAVRREERPHRCRALVRPARHEAVGVQAVHDEQAGDELVVDEPVEHASACSASASSTTRSSPPP